AKKVPYLTKTHKRARLAWARICKAYTLRIWRKKIWSDECYVYFILICTTIYMDYS
ncbi:hypothetical protein GALMADRAFT_79498, partial [Galerina marginata CBS 339.88]